VRLHDLDPRIEETDTAGTGADHLHDAESRRQMQTVVVFGSAADALSVAKQGSEVQQEGYPKVASLTHGPCVNDEGEQNTLENKAKPKLLRFRRKWMGNTTVSDQNPLKEGVFHA
jgi:hypothetical protein